MKYKINYEQHIMIDAPNVDTVMKEKLSQIKGLVLYIPS